MPIDPKTTLKDKNRRAGLAVLVAVCAMAGLAYGDVLSDNNYDLIVQNSVGKVILLQDSVTSYNYKGNVAPSRAAPILLFEEEYIQNIKSLPLENRISYLWSAMWHLELDGEYMERFQIVVFEDCADDFISKLEKYIKDEGHFGYSNRNLIFAQKVLHDLKGLESNYGK